MTLYATGYTSNSGYPYKCILKTNLWNENITHLTQQNDKRTRQVILSQRSNPIKNAIRPWEA